MAKGWSQAARISAANARRAMGGRGRGASTRNIGNQGPVQNFVSRGGKRTLTVAHQGGRNSSVRSLDTAIKIRHSSDQSRVRTTSPHNGRSIIGYF